jgi:hypothetical protein
MIHFMKILSKKPMLAIKIEANNDVWLCFQTNTGKSAAFNLTSNNQKGPIVNSTLAEWAKEYINRK